MAEDHIRYDILTQNALRGVVHKVLSEVEKTGLPGEHHFFISFATRAPGVRISERLLEKYDQEMTIVLQNQYWDLKVSETGFEVGLSFDNVNESLMVPYAALKGFFDPSVQFGLQFDTSDESQSSAPKSGTLTPLPTPAIHAVEDDKPEDADEKSESSTAEAKAKTDTKKETDGSSEDDAEKVVSLDSFRKKT